MPKVSEEHLEARRQQILEAAFRCFSHNGFHKTTMRDIYAESGLSAGAVYRYYKSKDDIIGAMCDDAQQRDAEIFGAAVELGDTVKACNKLISEYFESMDRPGIENIAGMWVQMWAEAVRKVSLREETVHEDYPHSGLLSIVQQAQECGEINPDLDPDAVVKAMLSWFQGLMLQKAWGEEVDVQEYISVIKAMLYGHFWVADAAPEGDPKKARQSRVKVKS